MRNGNMPRGNMQRQPKRFYWKSLVFVACVCGYSVQSYAQNRAPVWIVESEPVAAVEQKNVDLTGNIILGDLHIRSKADVDKAANVSEVFGDIRINVAGVRSIEFPKLKRIRGSLRIAQASGLNSVSMPKLESIVGDFEVLSNPTLGELKDFDALVAIGGSLVIENNPALQTISRFKKLVAVDGNLRIQRNGALRNIQGFDALTAVFGDLVIFQNISLQQLNGLNVLAAVTGKLDISKNDSLNQVSDMNALYNLKSHWIMADNYVLSKMPQMLSLRRVGGQVQVSNNGDFCQPDLEAWLRKLQERATLQGPVRVNGFPECL